MFNQSVQRQNQLLNQTHNLTENEFEDLYQRNLQNIKNNMNLDELEQFCYDYQQLLSNNQTAFLITEILQNSNKLRTMNISKFIANYFKPFGFFKKIAYNLDDKAIFDMIFKIKNLKIKKYQNFQLDQQKIYVVMNHDLILFQKTDYAFDVDLEFYNLGIEDFFSKYNLYFINHQVNELILKQIEQRLNCQRLIDKFQNSYNKKESLSEQLLYICYILITNVDYQLLSIKQQGEVIEDSNDEIIFANQTLDLVVFQQNHYHILSHQFLERDKQAKISNIFECAIFKNIPKRLFKLLMSKSKFFDIKMNQTILKQNQDNNYIFVIMQGKVNLYLKMDLQNDQTKKLLICQLQDNQIFGEKKQNDYDVVCHQDGQICRFNKRLIETGFFCDIQKNLNQIIQEKEQRYQNKIRLDVSNWEEIVKIDGKIIKDEKHQYESKQPKNKINFYNLQFNMGKKQSSQHIQQMNIQIWNERIHKMNGANEKKDNIPTIELNDQILLFKRNTQNKMIEELNKGLYKQSKQQFLKQKKDTYLLKVEKKKKNDQPNLTANESPKKQKSEIKIEMQESKSLIPSNKNNQLQNHMLNYIKKQKNQRLKQDRNKSQIDNSLQLQHSKINRSVQLNDSFQTVNQPNKHVLKMLKRVRDKLQLSGSKDQQSSLFTLNHSRLKTDYSINSLNNKNLTKNIAKKVKESSKNNFNDIINKIVKPKFENNYM